LGRLDDALTWYDAALRLRAAFPQAHYNRGNALRAAERFANGTSLKPFRAIVLQLGNGSWLHQASHW
jgi:hypothetical protein